MGEIKPTYSNLTAEEYTKKINTPAKNADYYGKFHQPLAERIMTTHQGKNPVLLNVACGHADELGFLQKEFPLLNLVGVDLDLKTLLTSTRGKINALNILTLFDTEEQGVEKFLDVDALVARLIELNQQRI